MRELDPSVEDDPYFLLSLGLALAHRARFEEEGADELERAAEALAELGSGARLRRPTITRGEFVWQRGDQDGAFAYFDRAPCSSPRARRSHRREAVRRRAGGAVPRARGTLRGGDRELVEQAIAMAEELGDDELLGDSLNNRAMVVRGARRPAMGGGQHTKRRARARGRTRSVAARAYINLGSNLVEPRATSHRAEAVTREGLALAERMGLGRRAMRWILRNLAEMTYLRGRWEEALELAEQVIVERRALHAAGRATAFEPAFASRVETTRGAAEDADDRARATRGRSATRRLSIPRS